MSCVPTRLQHSNKDLEPSQSIFQAIARKKWFSFYVNHIIEPPFLLAPIPTQPQKSIAVQPTTTHASLIVWIYMYEVHSIIYIFMFSPPWVEGQGIG